MDKIVAISAALLITFVVGELVLIDSGLEGPTNAPTVYHGILVAAPTTQQVATILKIRLTINNGTNVTFICKADLSSVSGQVSATALMALAVGQQSQ